VALGRFGPYQQVEMIRHEDPTIHPDSGLVAELAQNVDKGPAESLASENAVAAISARGDELKMSPVEMASIDWHDNFIGRRRKICEPQS